MEKITEHKRKLEDEQSRIMDLMVEEHVRSMDEQRDQRENINSMHRMKSLEERYKDISQKLRELQICSDVLRDSEIQEDSGPPEIEDFCSQLESLIEFHCHGINECTVSMPIKYVGGSADSIEFTDEEECGKYLDLRECHQHYMKLEGISEVDYITYVSTFDHLFDIPRERKDAQYCCYVKIILNYLNGYLTRVAPLCNVNDEMKRAELDFEAQWENGTFPGWLKEADTAQSNAEANLELSALSSWSELKSSLADLGLKCHKPIEKDVQGVFNTCDGAKLDFVSLTENGEFHKATYMANHKRVAVLEAMVYRLLDLVSIQRMMTIEKVQAMQGRTTRDHVDAECGTSADECQETVLYDENISYNCEHCENYTDNGPKACQRPFTELRHACSIRNSSNSRATTAANFIETEDAHAS